MLALNCWLLIPLVDRIRLVHGLIGGITGSADIVGTLGEDLLVFTTLTRLPAKGKDVYILVHSSLSSCCLTTLVRICDIVSYIDMPDADVVGNIAVRKLEVAALLGTLSSPAVNSVYVLKFFLLLILA